MIFAVAVTVDDSYLDFRLESGAQVAQKGCPICNTSLLTTEFPLLGYHTWAKRILTDGVAYGELPMYQQAAWTSLAVSITSYGRR
jgi:hypothetical protein